MSDPTIATPQPWRPANATRAINAIAQDLDCDLVETIHAEERMTERDLTTSDVLFVLRKGFVHEDALPDQKVRGSWLYAIIGKPPNTGPRQVRTIAKADPKQRLIKLITVMWRDENRSNG